MNDPVDCTARLPFEAAEKEITVRDDPMSFASSPGAASVNTSSLATTYPSATATGVTYTGGDLLTIGERVWNLERLFNIREGLTKKDDRLPYRFANVPMPNKVYSAKEKRALAPPVEVPPFGKIEKQPSAGSISHVSEMLPDYYAKRGWSADGVPTSSKLKNLGLTWA